MSRKVAFRCKNCGFLESPGNAGESDVPHACRACGHGVRFDPITGVKSLDVENWEVLAEASASRLDELGIEKSDVVKHKPTPAEDPDRQPKVYERSVVDTLTLEDHA
jgi:hypothetical protein